MGVLCLLTCSDLIGRSLAMISNSPGLEDSLKEIGNWEWESIRIRENISPSEDKRDGKGTIRSPNLPWLDKSLSLSYAGQDRWTISYNWLLRRAITLPLVLLLYHYTCLCAPSPAYARLCPSIGSYGSLYDTHEYIKLIISYAINLCRIIVAHFLEHINIQMVIITYNAYVRLCAPISAYVCLCASLSSYKLFGSVTR